MNSDIMLQRPLFIVGAARSGTTLLQYMLRSHPEISLPTAESHFFIPFYKRREEYDNLSNIDGIRKLLTDIYQSRSLFFNEDLHGIEFNADALASQMHREGRASIPEIISGIFEANARAEGKSRWGDKTPYYILHLDTLLEMFPDAQFVHLIRDGRDCALSMLERKKDLKIFNIYHAAYTWNKYVESGQEFGLKHPDNYFELMYEEILNHPNETIQALCAFLKIEFNKSVINFTKSDGSGKTPLLTKPLQRSNQAKWRLKMTKRQLSVFESLAGKTLEAHGYDLSSIDPSISPLAWFFYESHIKLSHFSDKYFPKQALAQFLSKQ